MSGAPRQTRPMGGGSLRPFGLHAGTVAKRARFFRGFDIGGSLAMQFTQFADSAENGDLGKI